MNSSPHDIYQHIRVRARHSHCITLGVHGMQSTGKISIAVLQNTRHIAELPPRKPWNFLRLLFSSMGGMRHSVRVAAWLCACFEHPAHPASKRTH